MHPVLSQNISSIYYNIYQVTIVIILFKNGANNIDIYITSLSEMGVLKIPRDFDRSVNLMPAITSI